MDTEIVEMNLPGGVPLLVRAERIDPDEGRQENDEDDGPSDIGLRQILSFTRITATVRGVATELHKALEAVSPDLVSVELGFDLAVKGSQVIALIADAGTHASIKVRLEWRGSASGEDDVEPDPEHDSPPDGEQ